MVTNLPKQKQPSTQINFSCPNFLLKIIDQQRGDYTRSAFVRLAIAYTTKTKLDLVRQPGKTLKLLRKI